MEKNGRARQATDNNIRRIACCVPKAKNIRSEYVIIIDLPLNNVRTRLNVTFILVLPVLFLRSSPSSSPLSKYRTVSLQYQLRP